MSSSLSAAPTIARNLMQRRFLFAVPDKLLSRLSYVRDRSNAAAAKAWCSQVAVDSAAYMKTIDSDLFEEAEKFRADLRERAEQSLRPLGIDPRSGGDCRLLYFLVRHCRPHRVVETGVAAGFSSQAILAALDANGDDGELWSTDLPYVRQRDSESLVGVLVEDRLRRRWHLYLDGDRRCLARVAREAAPIDFLHYDSDKTRRGRDLAVKELRPAMAENPILMFDDVDDNYHFRSLATSVPKHSVFHADGKYVGLAYSS